jgi:hypothetical protein
MEEYINEEGDLYTIDEINQTAKDNNTTFDDIIKRNKLALKPKKQEKVQEVKVEVPGKRKSVAKKDAGATVKSTVSKPVKPSSASSKVNLLKTSGVDDFASSLIKDDNKIKTGLGSSSIMWKSTNKKMVAKKVVEQEQQAKKQLELNKTADYRTKIAKDEISFESPDTILKYDLENDSQVETVAGLNKKLNRLGIEVSQNEFGDNFNFKPIGAVPNKFSSSEVASTLGQDFDPKDQKSMNEYIAKIKDPNYISKAKQRISKTNPDYLLKITPPALLPEEKIKQARTSMVSKFKDLEQSNRADTSSIGIGGSAGSSYTGITKQDFENPEDYDLYSTWKKTGILPELKEEKVIAWDKSRKENFIDRASTDYARTLPTAARKDLQIVTQEIVNENKHALKAFDRSINSYNVRTKDFENKFNAYKISPIKTPEEGKLLQDEFISLQTEQNRLNDRQKQLEQETGTANEVMLPAIESFGANYNRFSQLATATKATVGNVGVALKDLSAYGSGILTGSTHEEVMKRDTSGFVYLASEMDKKQKEYQKSVGIDKIRNMDDAGNWLMSGIVNNVPSIGMAFTGPAAMPLFFASGYGGKSTQMAIEASDAKERLSTNYYALKNTDNPFEQAGLEQQIASDEELLNLPEYKKFAGKALYGGAEVTFEILGTLKILKGLGNATKMLPKKTLQEGLKWAINTGAKNFKTEGLSELGTTLSNNFIDYAILGEDKNFFDVAKESLESFAQGGIMGIGFGGVETAKVIKRAVVSELASKKQSRRIQDIANQISELTGTPAYALNQGIPLMEQSIPVQKLITELIDESDALENNVINRVGIDLTVEQAIQIGDINREIRSINKDFYEAAQDGSLEPAQLKALETHYRGKFNELVDQRETLLTDPNITAESKKVNTDARFEFDLTQGYNMYNTRMQQTSINQVITNFNNLDTKTSEELLTTAKQELELETGKTDISTEAIKEKAFENYAYSHYEKSIKDGIINAEAFAENNGVDITIQQFEGADADNQIIKAYNSSEQAKENPKSKKEFADAIKNGSAEGANIIINGEQVALVHIKNSANNGRTGVGSHEVLHSAVKKAFVDQKGVDKAGADLLTYLEKYDPNLYALVTARLDSSYAKRSKNGLRLRDEKGDIIKDTDYYEEALNALSDLGSDGVELPADSLNAVRNFINNILPKGFPKFKENEGADIYQFVKDYNKEAHFGKKQSSNLIKFGGMAFGGDQEEKQKSKFSKTPVELVKEKIADLEENEGDYDPDEYDQEVRKLEGELKRAIAKETTEKPIAKKEISEEDTVKEIIKNESGSISSNKVQQIYDTKGREGAAEIIKLFKPITNKIVDKRRDAPDFDRELLTDEIETGVGGILDLITKYKPESGTPLAAWINKYLPVRAIATSRRILGKQFSKDASEEKGLMATETADQGFTETAKEKPKYKNALESKVFSTEVLETVTKKIVTILRTLKTRIDAPVSLNKTVTPLISEIRDEVGKQLDIDVKTAMGGKKDNQLQNWLLDNKQYVLENMTTTWSMGKDGQGGMPIAIQKQIDGKWTNFPEWVGKKIDREKTTTDQAGRTSGAELVRRLPNVNNNISDSQFLDQVIGPDGNPLRGRKESLAKAVAEETAFDIINNDLENEGVIYETLATNQQRLGVELIDNIATEVARQSERGNIKFSLTVKQFNDFSADLFHAASDYGVDSKEVLSILNTIPEEDRDKVKQHALEDHLDLVAKLQKIKAGIRGIAYEKIILKELKALKIKGIKLLTKKTKGFDSTGEGDINIQLGKDILNIEVKLNALAQMGSFSIDADLNNNVFSTTKSLEISKDLIDALKEKNNEFEKYKEEAGKIGIDTKSWPYKMTKEQHAILKTKGFQKKLTVSINTDQKIIEQLYNNKNVYYINIGKQGLFALGKDILNLGVPLLSSDVKLTARLVRGGEYNRIRVFPTLVNFKDKSKYNIDNAASNNALFTKYQQNLAIRQSKTTEDAVVNSLNPKFSKTPKGISVFDFDDTVGLTKGSVLYTMPDGSTGKLNAEEFAKEGGNMLDAGAVFDFSEFSKVVDGKPGPMVEKMKKMIGKFGPENFFILTARPANSAVPIHEFLSSIGIDIPLKNITGLGSSLAQSKADWMVAKATEGYNDFYFSDDAIQNVTAVKNALDVLDVKSKIQQARIKFSKSISPEFNRIISKNTGIGPAISYSDIVAKRKGAGKNLFDIYVPASAADFELLLYNFIGKGKEGEAQKEFFTDALLKPYANGNDLMDAARQSIKNNYKDLIKSFPNVAKKLEKLTPDGNFTYDQALRVAMWNGSDVEIPGLSKTDTKALTSLVNNDAELYDFMSGLIVLGRQGNGWTKPGEYWDSSTIISDLHNLTEGDGRKQFLTEFIDNAEQMFGKWENGKLVGPNINKVEAIYGTDVREAIEDVLYRMTTGKNRSQGKDKITNAWFDWVSGSTGTIMFLNTRSAALQLIGAVNFLNLRDNNPIAAAKALANQPQYWKDFSRIWNSDKMKERRGGLKEDVAAAEIANAAATSKNKPKAVVSYLLKIGYTPTQLADSFAIASGGAPFYRNRIKSYQAEYEGLDENGNLKRKYTDEQAEKLAWNDFTKVSDETQQSGDPRDISKQQASGAGRLLLTFQNTAMQQSRIVKKSFLDLKNGRGDAKTHIAKITYYLAIQNLMFATLQQGLFAVLPGLGDDKEEEEAKKKRLKEKDKKIIEIASGVVDSVVRGTGLLGGVMVTLKNVIKKYREEEPKEYKADYTKVLLEGVNISPPIGSKIRKIYTGLQQTKFEKDLIKERGWGVMQDGRVHLGPMYSVVGKMTEATTNFPMDRLVTKIENASQAMNSQNKAWQRVMVGMGWTPRSVGIEDTPGDIAIEATAKEVRKEEGKIKGEDTRKRTKDSIRALPIAERIKIKREATLKRREEKLKKRERMKKRKMG